MTEITTRGPKWLNFGSLSKDKSTYLAQLVCKEGVNIVGVVKERNVCTRQEPGGYSKAVEFGSFLKNIFKLGQRVYGGGYSRRQDSTKQITLLRTLILH